jgi:hypothetical protein
MTDPLGQAWDFVGPDVLIPEGMVRVAAHEEMLEETHVLQTKEGYLMVRLFVAC